MFKVSSTAQQEMLARLQDDPNAKRFFKKVREELEYTPGKLVVVEHFKEVIATEDTAGETQLVTAAEPARLIDAYAGASLLALIVTNRFGDHSPYYRDEDILSRLGYRIHRGTQCRCRAGGGHVCDAADRTDAATCDCLACVADG